MKRKQLRYCYLLFVVLLLALFFYFSLQYQRPAHANMHWSSATFILTPKAQGTLLLLLVSFPVYRFLRKRLEG